MVWFEITIGVLVACFIVGFVFWARFKKSKLKEKEEEINKLEKNMYNRKEREKEKQKKEINDKRENFYHRKEREEKKIKDEYDELEKRKELDKNRINKALKSLESLKNYNIKIWSTIYILTQPSAWNTSWIEEVKIKSIHIYKDEISINDTLCNTWNTNLIVWKECFLTKQEAINAYNYYLERKKLDI